MLLPTLQSNRRFTRGEPLKRILNFTGEFRIQLVQATQDQWVKDSFELIKVRYELCASEVFGNGEFFILPGINNWGM